jgi:hypothetical protein
MTDKDNGGHVYPQKYTRYAPDGEYMEEGHGGGMSLRDLFAGQALATLLHHKIATEFVAAHAYEVADAMLEARK